MNSGRFQPAFKLTRHRAVRVHQWLGLAACIFWLIQGVTGIISVFHWELEDASISVTWRPTNLGAIEEKLTALAPSNSGKKVMMIWATAGLPDRYDVFVDKTVGGATEVVRIAGDGTIIRIKDASQRNLFDFIIALHQSLLSGKDGRWIVGFMGLLLITSVLLGIRTAWPARGRWRNALSPWRATSRQGRLFGWHRSLGLIFAMPALILFSAGGALAYKDGLSSLIGAHPPTLAANRPRTTSRNIGFARAVEAAFNAAKTRRLTEVEMPTDVEATYRIRVLAPSERRRALGTTTVFVDANTGAVRGLFPAALQPLPQRFINALYAIHTGEIGGLAGRLLVLAVGVWLVTMVGLGLSMWTIRKRILAAKQSGERARALASYPVREV